jgi:hypothetical protein
LFISLIDLKLNQHGNIKKKDLQAKINRVFAVMSGILASYTFLSFFVLTFYAVQSYYNNVYGYFTSVDDDGNPTDNHSEEDFRKWFLVAAVSATLGMMIVLVLAHFSNFFLVQQVVDSIIIIFFYKNNFSFYSWLPRPRVGHHSQHTLIPLLPIDICTYTSYLCILQHRYLFLFVLNQ